VECTYHHTKIHPMYDSAKINGMHLVVVPLTYGVGMISSVTVV